MPRVPPPACSPPPTPQRGTRVALLLTFPVLTCGTPIPLSTSTALGDSGDMPEVLQVRRWRAQRGWPRVYSRTGLARSRSRSYTALRARSSLHQEIGRSDRSSCDGDLGRANSWPGLDGTMKVIAS